jgi:hypothetical protein
MPSSLSNNPLYNNDFRRALEASGADFAQKAQEPRLSAALE